MSLMLMSKMLILIDFGKFVTSGQGPFSAFSSEQKQKVNKRLTIIVKIAEIIDNDTNIDKKLLKEMCFRNIEDSITYLELLNNINNAILKLLDILEDEINKV